MSDALFIHPRENVNFVGHTAAERQLLDAWANDRLHHAWLIGGAEGVGKATLAYRFTRFLMAQNETGSAQDALFGADDLQKTTPSNMAVDAEDARVRMVLQGQHPDVKVIEPTHLAEDGKERAACELRVYQIRQLYEYLSQTSSQGGRRVVIIDTIDAMNTSAANALLKLLEEPPADTMFLLISHAPGRVLPTIRSRCRALTLKPLEADQLRDVLESAATDMLDPIGLKFAVRYASGSPGLAAKLYESRADQLHEQLLSIFASDGSIVMERLNALVAHTAKKGNEDQWDMAVYVYRELLARAVRYGSVGDESTLDADEKALFDVWLAAYPLDLMLDVWDNSATLQREVEGIHMDKSSALMNMIGHWNAA